MWVWWSYKLQHRNCANFARFLCLALYTRQPHMYCAHCGFDLADTRHLAARPNPQCGHPSLLSRPPVMLCTVPDVRHARPRQSACPAWCGPVSHPRIVAQPRRPRSACISFHYTPASTSAAAPSAEVVPRCWHQPLKPPLHRARSSPNFQAAHPPPPVAKFITNPPNKTEGITANGVT